VRLGDLSVSNLNQGATSRTWYAAFIVQILTDTQKCERKETRVGVSSQNDKTSLCHGEEGEGAWGDFKEFFQRDGIYIVCDSQ
jgi:hypothetical protein